ncbi:MAG: glycosyl transferase family 1 [Burkholderiaceae bacterium]|nr:glycosyl transferase family 1 [Burkholderiaceae bacterium]
MMRVLHFFKSYYPETVGGVEQVIRQIAIGTKEHGIENEVLTLSPSGQNNTISFDGHRVHRVPQSFEIASTGFSAAAISRLASLTKEFDLVHYHFPWPFMDVAHFLARTGKPSVVTYHSDIVRQKNLLLLYRPLMRRFLSSIDRIVATSPNYLASSPELNRYRDKTTVIPIGLEQRSYPVPSTATLERWRTQLGDRFFLFVGVLRYYKGLHTLLDAAQGTGYPVVIAGSGPVEHELKTQAQRLGLNQIHFLGAVSEEDKAALLQLCYGIVFPSHLRSEAFGISLLEGAMSGKPMISCEIGTGTSYINQHGETGFVVPPENPSAFRQAMQTLWNEPDLAASMGSHAQARYRQWFTATQMAQSYARLYQSLPPKSRNTM